MEITEFPRKKKGANGNIKISNLLLNSYDIKRIRIHSSKTANSECYIEILELLWQDINRLRKNTCSGKWILQIKIAP
jgi:hypothetical protein